MVVENKELGLKIAENTDEKFWLETKEKCVEGIKAAERNIKLDHKLIELCDEELKIFG